MAEKTELLRERYKQFADGDIESALSNWSDDFTWDGGNNDLPGGGVHEGKEEATKVLQDAVGSWDEFKVTPDEFFEGDDTVIVLAHSDVKKGDESETLPVVHVWRFSGDEEVNRLQVLTDSLRAAKLLGKV